MTRDNRNVLGFGEDLNSQAQPIGVEGEENNKLVTLSLVEIEKFQDILIELKKFNMQLESITNTKLTRMDAQNYKEKL